MARCVVIAGLSLGWLTVACCLAAVGDEVSRDVELIQERYPDGSIKLAREMTLDAERNYINHGSWTLRDEQGRVVEQGNYRRGVRHGEWEKHYRDGDVKILAKAPYDKFSGPFVSRATFTDGELHGKWTMHDSENRLLFELNLIAGRRENTQTWWHAGGAKRLQISYVDGLPHGEALKWDEDAQLLSKSQYFGGRKLAKRVEYFPAAAQRDRGPSKASRTAKGRQKQSEGIYLLGQLVEKTRDEWAAAKFATYDVEKALDRHGAWKSWYPSGKLLEEGEYRHDERHGKFTRWRENGQKEIDGEFNEGERHGDWTWWHASGIKMAQGSYDTGTESSEWSWWSEAGKLHQTAAYSKAAEKVETNVAETQSPQVEEHPSSANADDSAPAFPLPLRR